MGARGQERLSVRAAISAGGFHNTMRRTLTLGNTLRLRAHRTMVLIPRPLRRLRLFSRVARPVRRSARQAGTTDPAQTKAPLRLARAGRSISGIHAQPEPGSYARSSPADVSKLSIGSVKRVISFARASTPNRALALRRGLGDYQVVSSAPPLLLILPTSVLTTQGAAVRVCVSMANAPVDRQRRSPIPNSEPICSDVKRSAITSWRNLFACAAGLDISCQHGCPTPACCIAVATPFELDPRP